MPAINNHQAISPTPNLLLEANDLNLPTREHSLVGSPSAWSIGSRHTRREITHVIFTHVWNGLAIFAIVVIIRHASARALVLWKRRKSGQQPVAAAFDPYNPPPVKHLIDPRIGPVFQLPGGSVTSGLPQLHQQRRCPHQQQVHYRFAPLGAPPFWMMDHPQSRGVKFSDPPQDRKTREDVDGQEEEEEKSRLRTTSEERSKATTIFKKEGNPRKQQQQLRVGLDHPSSGSFMARRLPPPPLTPPELSTTLGFPAETRRSLHSGGRFPNEIGDSFIHQPNPDYMSATEPISTMSSSSSSTGMATAPGAARRRSYSRALPIGIPTPQDSNLSAADGGAASHHHPGHTASTGGEDFRFSPSSYPPTSPQLPPPPPGYDEDDDEELREDGDGRGENDAGKIEVQGEIVSVTSHHGVGWTRHTRVYGGGVCLACAASGGEGGFYGATVREEDKR